MTNTVVLIHSREAIKVSAELLIQKCGLFANDPTLTASPYHVKSKVWPSIFRKFVSVLKGKTVTIKNNQLRGLSKLCNEFHFRDSTGQLSQFCQTEDFWEEIPTKDKETGTVISIQGMNCCTGLFEETFTFSGENATFECGIGQAVSLSPSVREQLLVDACARTFALGNVNAVDSIGCILSGKAVSVVPSPTGLGWKLCNPSLELELALSGTDRLDLNSVNLSMFSVEALDGILNGSSFSIASEDDLLEKLLCLDEKYHPLLSRIAIQFLSLPGRARLMEHLSFPTESIWCGLMHHFIPPFRSPSPLGSLIIWELPEIFAEFRGKQFLLLWRGSRDGFGADKFHRRCDRHGNTLTVILDTDGNIFGGFTPLEWTSHSYGGYPYYPFERYPGLKVDPSDKTFIFTLKNPYHVPARRFALNSYCESIGCDAETGPEFGYHKVSIADQCNRNTKSYTDLDINDVNDIELDGKMLLTGRHNFQVREIEVFEITD
jgi:hypothetical protein